MADGMNGRSAIVTGAASGVGKAPAARFVTGSECRIDNGQRIMGVA
ncbi:hypothetical protein [Burkholderia sp. Ac-20353]|nr:hypothetical protein [Burkholderia sp. Ac-20353]MBN3791516.1 hypothetical protein [Burkholderia sp. Ac-20353]